MGKMRVFFTVSLIVAIMALGAGPAAAAPLKTNLFGLDGLFVATGGSTLEAGALAVGGSMLIINDDLIDKSTVPVTVTYGATSTVEIAAAFEAYKSFDDGATDDTGSGDLYLSAKFAVQKETPDYPAAALGLRLKLPMADAPLSSEETDITIFAAAGMDMKGVTGVLNVEYFMPGTDDENQVNYVVGVAIPYSDTTDFTLELMDNDLVWDMFAAGATFDMGPALNFGMGVGFGLNDTSADFAALGKLTFSF
ncbi:MAG: hypothetical protein RRA32_07865 [bacterium]|nr:hypothetical protein [bacterium]